MVYLDEAGFNQHLHSEYARAPRGTQVFSDIKGKKYQRINMIAAQCQGEVLAPMVFEGNCDRMLFEHWFETQLLPRLTPGKVIVMDNYTIHKSNKIQIIAEEYGCRVLFLPPYSPDLNPIEHLWANIKAKVKKILKTINDFNTAIDLAFKQC